MKIILSRKGFDSSNGGFPSPIMPDERLLSLPIPVTKEDETGVGYDKLEFNGPSLSEIITQLNGKRRAPFRYGEAHLDPDLDRERFQRCEGWRAVFGQTGAAQGHLNEQGVGVGDLFLFYGWFRRTKDRDGSLCYDRPRQDLHVIFGWLQIGKIIKVCQDNIPDWLQYHPHVRNANVDGYVGKDNTIYRMSKRLELNGHHLAKPGAGVFCRYRDVLRLTAHGEHCRSHWCLPKWFYPFDSYGQLLKPALTYNGEHERWILNDDHVILKTKSPGQEFVFDTVDYPKAAEWIEGLFRK